MTKQEENNSDYIKINDSYVIKSPLFKNRIFGYYSFKTKNDFYRDKKTNEILFSRKFLYDTTSYNAIKQELENNINLEKLNEEEKRIFDLKKDILNIYIITSQLEKQKNKLNDFQTLSLSNIKTTLSKEDIHLIYNFEDHYQKINEELNIYNNLIKDYNKIANKLNKLVIVKDSNYEVFNKILPKTIPQNVKTIYNYSKNEIVISNTKEETIADQISGYIPYVYRKNEYEGFLSAKGSVVKAINQSVIFPTQKEAQIFASRKGFKAEVSFLEISFNLKNLISVNETGPLMNEIKILKDRKEINKILDNETTTKNKIEKKSNKI